jgi:hypothetical protein
MSGGESLKNELAKRDLVIQTLQSVKAKEKEDPPKVDEEKDEFGLEKDDQYAPVFKKMFDAIGDLKTDKVVDAKAEFETNLKSFADKNKDIVQYANDMDKIGKEHPTLMTDIPKLYTLAKKMAEGRKTQQKRTETTGNPSSTVIPIQQGKTIAEAFELAEGAK